LLETGPVTLRLRFFLLLAGLVALLVAGQTLLVRSLAERLDRDVAVVAARVGEDILSGFEFRADENAAEPAVGDGRARVLVVTHGAADDGESPATGGEGEREPTAPEGAAAAASPGGETTAPPAMVWKVERSWDFRRPDGRVESGSEVRVLDAAPGEGAPKPFKVLVEPDAADDVLFLRGPALDRRIRVPRAPVASTLDRFRSELAVGSLALLGLGLAGAALLAHRATRPLAALAGAARRIGSGELGVEVPVDRRDEIGQALAAFNAMSTRLADLDRENRRLAENERLSELGEVARGLAHTLRNPLNALGLSIEELAAGGDAGRAAELAESSRRQIRRIDGGLRSFLALASAPAAEPEPVDLAALAREVALEALQDAGGRVRIEVEAAAPVVVAAVAAEAKAIVQALVVNACEASPEGGRVTVRVARGEDARARLRVEDEGPGVAAAVRERLFAPHVTTKPHGSGMGLFLARRLAVGRYGGAIELADRPAGGTVFEAVLGDRVAAAS
jgi:signal transduction histidine kinase